MNYAAAVVLEVRTSPSSSEPFLRFQFKNGTDDTELHPYPLVFPGWDGSASGTDVPLSTLISAFQLVGINTTLEWCNVCGQTTERGCDVALVAAKAGVTQATLAARSDPFESLARPCGPYAVALAYLGGLVTALILALAVGCLLTRWRRTDRRGNATLEATSLDRSYHDRYEKLARASDSVDTKGRL